MNYKIFVSDDPAKIRGKLNGIVGTERTPGGVIISFRYMEQACEAMRIFRNSGYREVIALWH